MSIILVLVLVMVCAAFAYVGLKGKPRKKPDIENQTTKRCPYRDCNWWIIFKDLNNEVRRLYKDHYLEVHKAASQARFEGIEESWLLGNQPQLLRKSVAKGAKCDYNKR
jgi:hypothetical protein